MESVCINVMKSTIRKREKNKRYSKLWPQSYLTLKANIRDISSKLMVHPLDKPQTFPFTNSFCHVSHTRHIFSKTHYWITSSFFMSIQWMTSYTFFINQSFHQSSHSPHKPLRLSIYTTLILDHSFSFHTIVSLLYIKAAQTFPNPKHPSRGRISLYIIGLSVTPITMSLERLQRLLQSFLANYYTNLSYLIYIYAVKH